MKVVIAINSFKNSLSSLDAGHAAAAGVRKAYGDEPVDIVVKPLADGGEGTVEALVTGMNGEYRYVTVSAPLSDQVDCVYGYLPENNTAIIEMSGAAGLGLVPKADKNPMNTSAYGVGEVIRDAMDSGTRNFIIGLGGSATNDCGLGMLQALGYGFYDKNGEPVGRGGKALNDVARIDVSQVPEELKECRFKVACDVNNPLCGPNGSAMCTDHKKARIRKWLFFVNNFSLKKASKFPFFGGGNSPFSAGTSYASCLIRACSIR